MHVNSEIELNKFAQGLEPDATILEQFKCLSVEEKRNYLTELIYLIIQSKPADADIINAINASGLKSNFTPCVMLKKGFGSLYEIVKLPENELNKVASLMLHLFKIAYLRRFQEEKNNPEKWWYKDLSQEHL